MQFDTITYEVKGKTTEIVTLNRAGEAQCAGVQAAVRAGTALLEADEFNPVDCVVLRGSGPHFCAGANVSEMLMRPWARSIAGGRKPMTTCGGWSRGRGCECTMFDMHKPVIAQVHGTCIGIGGPAGFCDMVIVADDARIGFPPVRDLGTPPGCDVAVSLRAAMGETAAADRRQRWTGTDAARHRPGAEMGIRPELQAR